MDPELDNRLRAIEKKLDATYTTVAQVRRVQRNANLMKAAYWVIIILFFLGAFYFIKPMIAQLGSAYGLTGDDAAKSSSLLDQLKQFQEMQ